MKVMKCEVVLLWLSVECQNAMLTCSHTSETFIYLSIEVIADQ